MLSCSALAGLSFMLNFIFEFGMSVEFIEGARGLPVAVLNCYTYHKSKALTNGMKFTCGKRKSVKCKAFVVVSDDGTVVKAEYSHNHPTLVTYSHQPNPGDVQVPTQPW